MKGQIICTIEGDLIQILKAERVALNFLGHLSGIATYTRRFVKAIEGTKMTFAGLKKPEERAAVIKWLETQK